MVPSLEAFPRCLSQSYFHSLSCFYYYLCFVIKLHYNHIIYMCFPLKSVFFRRVTLSSYIYHLIWFKTMI